MQNFDRSLAEGAAESGFRNAASDTVRVRYRQVYEAACRSVSMTKNLAVQLSKYLCAAVEISLCSCRDTFDAKSWTKIVVASAVQSRIHIS